MSVQNLRYPFFRALLICCSVSVSICVAMAQPAASVTSPEENASAKNEATDKRLIDAVLPRLEAIQRELARIPAAIERQKDEVDWKNPSCDKPRNHDEADLCQQKFMAESSDQQAHLAIWQVIVTVIGTIGLIGTIVYTHLTFRLSATTSERQLRAYLCKTMAELRNLEIGGTVQAHVVMKNCGQTPAYDVTACIGIGLGPYDPNAPLPQLPVDRNSKSMLGPGAEHHLTVFLAGELTQQHVAQLENGQFGFHVIGRVEYRDAFGVERFTNFNLIYGAGRWLNQNGVLTNAANGNDAN